MGIIGIEDNICFKVPDSVRTLQMGTHMCHFFSDINQLMEISMHFIKQCESTNIFCLWLLSNNIDEEKIAGNSNIKDLSYEAYKAFDFNKEALKNKLQYVKSNNFNGLCILNTSRTQLIDLLEDEKTVILVEQYSLSECTPYDVIDISVNYQYVLTKRKNLWILTENSIQKKVKEELENSKKFYLTLFDEFPALIWSAGLDTLCNYFNKNWLKFTGRALEEEVGNGWAEGVHPEDFNRCVEYYLENFYAKKPFSMEYRLKRFDGEYRYILDMGMPFYGLDGEFAGYIGSCYDITERINMEKQLQISAEVAQKATEDKSFFISQMSHEIRTPLSGIVGMINLISLGELNQQQQEYVKLAKSSSNILTRVINDILDLSRLEAGRLELVQAPFNLKELAERILKTFDINNKKELAIKLHIAPFTTIMLKGDEVRISQIIMNLVGNAIKFTDKGEIRLAFSTISEASGKVILKGEVKDTGIGMPENQLNKLFTSFSQLSNLGSRKYSGSGLGLLITKLLVQQMNGEIQVESVEGLGSVFSFTLMLDKV